MSKKHNVRIPDYIAEELGLKLNNSKQYRVDKETLNTIRELRSSKTVTKVITKSVTKSNDYKEKPFVLSAWSDKGVMMDIDTYCKHYNLPKKDISSYKLVSHTGTPFYNIVFKENRLEIDNFDFEATIKKHTENLKPISHWHTNLVERPNDFDTLTYADVHIAMETNSKGNSMYADKWTKKEILESAKIIGIETLKNQSSNVLIVDELGDFLDGYNSQTTRGGHHLPQNMTNEEAFDCGLEFKMLLLNSLVSSYDSIIFNNICNDNHAGSFGYFVNSAFKQLAEKSYTNVTVNNHRTFISHYIQDKVCFIITHGKDDSTLKFGFKPHLDAKQIEKIDQYIKQNNLYGKAERFIFKKGDSHQCLFDLSGSDDFDYFNYPALSPSSQWVQNNFKKGRRGFVIENFKGIESNLMIKFIK